MDRDLWRRRLRADALPYLGLLAGVSGATAGMRAFAAGVRGAGVEGYVVAALLLLGGYGAVSRGVNARLDRVYYASVAIVTLGVLYTFGVLDPPPTVYEIAAR